MKKLEVLSALTEEQKQLLRDMRKGYYGAYIAEFLTESGEIEESAAVTYKINDISKVALFNQILKTEGIGHFLSRKTPCETEGEELVFVKWDFRNDFFGFLFNND